jgi:hypothetical protein
MGMATVISKKGAPDYFVWGEIKLLRSLRPGVRRSRSDRPHRNLGVSGSLFITRAGLSHYMSNRSEIDAEAKSLFDAVAQGIRSRPGRCFRSLAPEMPPSF